MLVGDPAWRVLADGGHLVVTAGADAVWLVEDVPDSVAELIATYWSAAPVGAVPAEARPVVEHLVALGALRPVSPAAAAEVVVVAPIMVGDPIPGFEEALARRPGMPPGVRLVVRSNAPLRSLVDVAAELHASGTRHVLCDLAFARTVAVGPDVVPGDTACIACLATRVGGRWGDPPPPLRPGAADDPELAALLAVRAVVASVTGVPGASLVHATVTLDLATLGSRREALWRVPGCAVCDDWPSGGTLRLPWHGPMGGE